ncbi:Digestive organ expansion factor, partial [Eschrichtius robustus]|nr:Digestive organ expansion factor [Eschrichtius robustus]
VSRKEAKPQTCQLSESLDTSSSESEAESEPEQVSGYNRLLATLKDVSKEDEEEEEEEDSVIDETEMNLEDGDSDISVEEETAVESTDMQKNPFAQHVNKELKEKEIQAVATNPKTTHQLKWPILGQLVFSSRFQQLETFKPPKDIDLKSLHLQKPLESTWIKTNSQFLSGPPKSSSPFTPLQKELFLIMNSYRDLFYPERTALKNGEEIRHVYCLHVINHVLKANAQVLANNSRCRSRKLGVGDDDDFRDQGLTRPKVLIVVPFREAALRVVQLFISLLEGDSKKKIIVSNKKRFNGEYGSDPEERPPNLKRPEDYEAVFVGNIDDHFRTGVAILQRSIRLYAPFYSSDILIASPLGLRTIIAFATPCTPVPRESLSPRSCPSPSSRLLLPAPPPRLEVGQVFSSWSGSDAGRYTIKGIRNLIFYELPTYPHFYSDVCNMLQATTRGEEAAWTCTVLYSKYDAQRLAAVVGVERAAQMLQSKKNVHLFITGER